MGGIGAHLPARAHQPAAGEPLQQRVQHHLFQAAAGDTGPELAQDRVVEARIRQAKAQRVLPVDPGAHRLGGLPVGQVLRHLEDRHQGQAGRRPARLAAHPVGARELLIGQPLTQLVTHHHWQRALPLALVHRPHRGNDLRRGLRPRPRLHAHHGFRPAADTRGGRPQADLAGHKIQNDRATPQSQAPQRINQQGQSRWREEYFLKYASENYGIDKICDYIAAIETNTKIIDNPARKTGNPAVRQAQKTLAAAREDMAVMLADPAIPAAAKNAKLTPAAAKTLTRAERALATAEATRDKIPAKLPASVIDSDAKIALLRTRRRGLQMILRLLAHNAEHWLSNHLNAYLRDDREYRAITRQTIIRGLAGVITYTPARSPSNSSSPTSPASPAPWPCSWPRSTPPRPACPATPGPSHTTRGPAPRQHSTAGPQQLPDIWAPEAWLPAPGQTTAPATVGFRRRRATTPDFQPGTRVPAGCPGLAPSGCRGLSGLRQGRSGLALVELAVTDALDERFPLAGGEDQRRPVGVLGVTHGPSAVRRLGCLDAVSPAAVAEGGLVPDGRRQVNVHLAPP